MAKRLRICFVAPNAFGALTGRPDVQHFGGAEVQQSILARALVRRGHSVSMVTYDHGQPAEFAHDGVRVIKMCRPTAGVRGLRFLYPRWTSLCVALRRAGADVYYQRAAGTETGQVALWCGRHHLPFVFAAASDTNCDARLPDLGAGRERLLYRAGLRRAAAILCQTTIQSSCFRQNFALESRVIANCAEDPYAGRFIEPVPTLQADRRVLWVGRAAAKKRFEWVLDLADLCRDIHFDVVGVGASEHPYSQALLKRATALANVNLLGRLPPKDVGPLYDRAAVLLCTSPVEGFPNTFLEAWSRGIPIVSTVDPDDAIIGNGLGAVAGTVEGLRAAMLALFESAERWRDCSRRARAYFLSHHSVDSSVQALEEVLEDVTNA